MRTDKRPAEKKETASSKAFDYSLDYSKLDLRKMPHLYRVGKGEQGVLLVEPYKHEIGPHWRFRTPEVASQSAQTIYKLFLQYLENDDFIGADMASKYLQMGFTRSRRYARHKSGKKYESGQVVEGKYQGSHELPLELDESKNQSATIFYKFWQQAEANSTYSTMKHSWKKRYG